MATVTGMTAEAMEAIRDGVVVDGDVVGNNLILTKYDGSTINAGNVKGPKGDTGSAGISSALALASVLDVGIPGQVRAGRQLTTLDFTNMGLGQPIGLFNLSDLTNLGSAGGLTNKGAVPFGVGINGLASTAAVFAGSSGQALWLADAAGGPFNPKTFSMGAWFRTAKRGTGMQSVAGKSGPGTGSATGSYLLYINSNNQLQGWVTNGSNDANAIGSTDVCDDRWHFVVMTWDGTMCRLFVDGVLEAQAWSATSAVISAPQQINEPFAIGASDVDSTNGNQFWGRVDEVFITSDVLSEEQVRLLYCAKIPHGYGGTPKSVMTNVHRRRRGVPLVVGDFPTQPKRLHNLIDLSDLGTIAGALTANPGTGAIVQVAGPEGAKDTARHYSGLHTGDSASDTGLPSGTAARSLGAWIKASDNGGNGIIGYGTVSTGESFLLMDSLGVTYQDGPNVIRGPLLGDGQWHHVVAVIDPAAGDGLKAKLYVDGKLVASGTAQASTTLVGANRFRIGARSDGTVVMDGSIARAFVTDYALSPEQIRSLYAKGGQDLGASPKNSGDHIELVDATSIYATFDTIEPQHQVDLAVAA